jgi:hypothetical protein
MYVMSARLGTMSFSVILHIACNIYVLSQKNKITLFILYDGSYPLCDVFLLFLWHVWTLLLHLYGMREVSQKFY